MIYKRYASDFMTSNVITGGKNNSFTELLDFFTTHKIQHLPIADDNKLIGILTVNDMLRFLAAKISEGRAFNNVVLNDVFRVEDVMTPNPVCVSSSASQKDVLEILSEGKFQAVPVVDEDELVGIITNKDIARIYDYDITHIL